MKKFILVIAVVAMGTMAYGQAKLEIGLKGGLNFADINAENVTGISYDTRTAWHMGAYGLIKIANIGIQPEVLYSTQGSEIDFGAATQDFESAYLTIPVMAKFYLPLGLNLQAGPQFGLLVSAEQGANDIKDDLKNSDITAALGAGWDAPFGLSLTARYLIGLNDINDAGTDAETKNRVLQLSLGYRLFKIGN